MSMIALLLAASVPSGAHGGGTVPACRAAQLRLTVNGEGLGGMSHDGAELSLRNRGPTCRLPSAPATEMRDARGRVLGHGVVEQPAGALRLGAGQRATILLRWLSNDVVDHPRHGHARRVAVRIGGGSLSGAVDATMVASGRARFDYDQQPAQIAGGGSAG